MNSQASQTSLTDSGGGVEFHGYTYSHDQELVVQWFHDHKSMQDFHVCRCCCYLTFCYWCNATVTCSYILRSQLVRRREAVTKIPLDSEMDASIRASLFNTVLPSILSLLETKGRRRCGGASLRMFDRLYHIKDFPIWHPHSRGCCMYVCM
jgi:hypothetical protein